MFIRQLQYLLALEREGHFGRAADTCHVAQPSLSSAIKSLEEELDVPIIVRTHKFVGFTDEGREVLKWARKLLANRSAMLDELAILKEPRLGTVRIGAMPMSSPVLPALVNLFTAKHPGIKSNIQIVGRDQLESGLMNFDFDVGITYVDDPVPEYLNYKILYKERFSLLVPDNGWFENQIEVSWKAAASVPLCLLTAPMRERQIVDDMFRESRIQPEVVLESNSIFQLAFHVMKSEMATIIPNCFIKANQAFSGTRVLPLCNPEVFLDIGIFWNRIEPARPMTKAMISAIEDFTKQQDGLEDLVLGEKWPAELTPSSKQGTAAH